MFFPSLKSLLYFKKENKPKLAKEIKLELLDLWKYDVKNHRKEIGRIISHSSNPESAMLSTIHNFHTLSLPSMRLSDLNRNIYFFIKFAPYYLQLTPQNKEKQEFMEILGLMIKFYSAEELSEEDLIDFGQMETLLLFLEKEGSAARFFY